MTSAVYTNDFKTAFEAQTQRMLRTRFLWFLLTVALIYVLASLASYSVIALLALGVKFGSVNLLERTIAEMRGGMWGLWFIGALTVIDVLVYVGCVVYILRRPMKRETLLRFTQWFLVYRGVMDFAALFIANNLGFPWSLMFYHMLACAFLPWTPEQAIRPMGPLLVLNAILVLVFGGMSSTGTAFTIVMSLFAAAPGVGIAAFKTSRRTEQFRVQMLQARYGQMRRELVDARRIHEALFPRPIQTGPLRLDYRYEPMRQIGGDYLYARFSPGREGPDDGAFNLLLLDVTGHGIAAALTVNRLYGEVERLYAENPHAGPDEVMCALNRYVHLTLATHSIYATALCIRFDAERGMLDYSSGGHPPAFLCTANGRIEQLDSTAFVLGACATEDFRAHVQSRRFEAGDTLLAYTDGALECRNEQGRMLGVDGLLRVIASCVGARNSVSGGSGPMATIGLSSALLSAVDSHRFGLAEDDTLVVEVSRAPLERPGADAGTRESSEAVLAG